MSKRRSRKLPWQVYGIGGLVAFGLLSGWVSSRVVTATADAGRDAIADAYHALEDDARAVFDAWLDVYRPPFETMEAALHALAAIASSPGAAIADAWTWWRSDYDPQSVTPEEPPFDATGEGGFTGRGASGRW